MQRNIDRLCTTEWGNKFRCCTVCVHPYQSEVELANNRIVANAQWIHAISSKCSNEVLKSQPLTKNLSLKIGIKIL